jgi:peroxin-5
MDPKPDFNLFAAATSLLAGPESLPQPPPDDVHFQDLWEAAEAENWDEFNQAWEEPAQQPVRMAKKMGLDEFCDIWQQMWPMEELQLYDYPFESVNPFVDVADPWAVAQEALAKGEISEALLALEAAVRRNPEAADLWVLIGKLNAENDEDNRAVAALNRAYSIDNYNLEAILSLGISLINSKQDDRAMDLLIKWIEHNPSYMNLASTNLTPQEKVVDLYTQASNMHPDDASLFQVLGSIYFMHKEYDLAVSAFENAVGRDNDNYYSWNRLGAALAHKGDNQNAICAYQKALEIRPRYVRAWANLGIAHANLDLMVDAARYYLCALSYNRKAAHIWNYLFTAFACLSKGYLGRFDLLEKVKEFEPMAFEEEFRFMAVRNLGFLQSERWEAEFLFENS